MGSFKAPTLGFALTLLVLTSYTYASSIGQCRSGCRGAHQHFKYVDGTTYKYNLEGNIDIGLPTAEGQSSHTKLKATVLVTQLPECNQLLRIQNIQVIGPDGKKHSNIDGINKPIRINFHDGRIEDSICADADDTQNSLNIKRAVASLFQASVKDRYETDVFGVCPTEIHTHKEGHNVVIRKHRNLNKCSHRETVKQDFLTTAFDFNSEIKSSPVLNGQYTSEQIIKNGILDRSTVTENYLYVPFSVGQNGAKAIVTTKISFVGTTKENPQDVKGVPKSIIFESPHLITTSQTNIDSILSALKETKNTIDLTVGETSAKAFANLIKVLRNSKKDDILSVYGQVKAGAGFKDKLEAKKIFFDALFRAGTGETVEVGIELLKNKELNHIEEKFVYLGLAFVKHATASSVATATKLLDHPHIPREAYLGVGILAGRFCREHSCVNVDAINKLMQKLISKLGDGKPKNKEEENHAISVLKTLANIETLNDAAIAKVVAIAQDNKAPNRLRVAALETYLADACEDKIRDSAFNILKDIQQDSEIRIKAYLAVAKCPNGKIANGLKTLLDKEPSYQVGGFIVSHIKNLRATSNPDKELAKHHLSQIHTTRKFPIDIRKYSHNMDFSHYVDSLGLATSAESNVIYSQNSFAPRSAELNLTAEVFGHSVNFLEVGLRQENLEKVLEHYFGPLGVFNEASREDLIKSGKHSIEKLVNHFSERLRKTREKRDVSKANIDNIGKEVQIKTHELNKDLNLDLSVKLFGSELLFLSINDESAKYNPEAIIDSIFDHLEKTIAHAKNFEKTIQTNLLFLDSEFSYPTSLGFALRLSVEGSSSIKLKTAGQIDISTILKENNEKSPFKFSLIPSANIEITGRMTIDAQVIESGLKVISTLHSATGGDLEVVFVKGGKGFDVKVSLPVQHQKLISATNKLVFSTRELGKTEVDHPIKFGHNKDLSICVDQLSPFIGLAFCADINSPPEHTKHGLFALNGNAKFAVSIENEDLSYIRFKQMHHDLQTSLGAEYLIEIMGKDHNKKSALSIEAFVIPDTYLKATLITPLMPMTVEGRIINNNQEKSIFARFEHDKQKYSAKLGASISGSPEKTMYKPLVEYNGPGLQGQQFPVNVEGAIIVERKGHGITYIFDDVKVIRSSSQKVVSVKGNMGQDVNRFFTDLTMSDGSHSGSLKSNIQHQTNSLKIEAEFKNNFNPDFNFHVQYDGKRQAHQLDSHLEIVHGHDLASKVNRFTLINMIYYNDKKGEEAEGKTKNKFSYPAMKIEAEYEFEFSNKHLEYELELHYGATKLGSELSLKAAHKDQRDYNLKFKVYGFDSKLEAKARREVTGEKSKIENTLDINGKKYELSGTIDHHIKNDDIKVGSDLVIKVPIYRDPIKFQDGLILNNNELDAHLKISSGSNAVVDMFVKANKDGDANGNLKIALKDLLVANGQLRVVKGTGNSHIIVELPKSNKVKVESTFTISEPTYNLVVIVHPNFEKDSEKYTFSTENQVKSHSIESKNFVEMFNKKVEANFKGSCEGSSTDGKQEIEADVTLPSGRYFFHKFVHELRITKGTGNGNMHAVLEERQNKNTPGYKLDVKGVLKNINTDKELYDAVYDILLLNKQEKAIIAKITSKKQLQDDKNVEDGNIKLSGSLLPSPIEINGHVSYKNDVGSYKFDAKCDSGNSLSVDGKYDFEEESKKMFEEINVDLTTQNELIHVVKFGASGTLIQPETPEGDYKYSGSVKLFVDDKGAKPDAIVDVHLTTEASGNDDRGQLKSTLKLQKKEPIMIDLGYAVTSVNEAQKLNGHLVIQYAKDQIIKSDLDLILPNENEIKLDIKLHAPHAPNSRLELMAKKSSDDKVFNGELILTSEDKKFTLTSDIVSSDVAPLFDLKLVYPNGKEDRIAVKVDRMSPKEFSGEMKIIINEIKLVLESSLDANVASPDDFFIKLTANAPILKVNNVDVEVSNKPSKSGKRIQIVAKSDGKNIVSGSTNYKLGDEGGKHVLVGSGSIKIHEQNEQLNFKIVRQILSKNKHGEEGEEILLNVMVGSKAIAAEFKCTDKHFRILNSYCEKQKQCANIEIDAKTDVETSSEYKNKLEIAVDLRNLGLAYEFGLKGVTNRKNFILDHTVDVYFQSKSNKYQYSLYVHPNEAGVQLTTPKRIISLEGTVQLPRHAKGKMDAPLKGEVAFYLNKKDHPDKKTALMGIVNCPSSDNCRVEFKLNNPALSKDLMVSYIAKCDLTTANHFHELIIDTFSKPEDKIVVVAKRNVRPDERVIFFNAKSEGLHFNVKYELKKTTDSAKKQYHITESLNVNVGNIKQYTGLVWNEDPNTASLLVTIFNKEVLHMECNLQEGKDFYKLDTNTQVLGLPSTVSSLELKEPYSFTFYIARKDNPGNKLLITANVNNEIAKVDAEVNKDGSKHELLHASIKLDEKDFLKSDYKVNSETVKNVADVCSKRVKTFLHGLKDVIENGMKESHAQSENFAETLKNHLPDARPVNQYYVSEMKKFREELLSDKTIKDIDEFLKNIFRAFVISIDELIKECSGTTEKVMSTLQKEFGHSINVINKEIVPKVKEYSKKAVTVGSQVLNQISDIVLIYVAKLSTFLESHQAEIKEIINHCTILVQDVGRFFYNFIKSARSAVRKEMKDIYEKLKNLPISEELKIRYEQITDSIEVPSAVINTIKEIFITLKDAVPSPEMKKLVSIIGDYIEKKLKGEPVEDVDEIKIIVTLFMEILDQILKNADIKFDSKLSEDPLALLETDLLGSIPKRSTLKFSPLNYILAGHHRSLNDILQRLSLNPKDLIPPYKLDAVIVQGQHLFTFDGKHLTFPGNCDYLLARDAVNGNFTIVGTFTNGMLSALTFADKTNMVTVKKGGQVLLNNAATELPIHKPHLHVLSFYGLINIKSKSGVEMYCLPDLTVCSVHVSGYYHAQLRGLLGNGNFEPFDDYTLPNGKIVSSESEFGNSYKMAANCAPVTTVDHSAHHHNPVCSRIFGEDSPLRRCYRFVSPENYKTACEHGLAAGIKDTERLLVLGYVASCKSRSVPIHMPSEYVECKNGQHPYKVGDTFIVKTPSKAADIVVVVDQVKANEHIYKELVQPVIAQVSNEFNSKGITDVEMHLITYGGENEEYPSHHTVAGKFTFKGKSPNLKFVDKPKQVIPSTGSKYLDELIKALEVIFDEIELITDQTSQQQAYIEAMKYPFRPHAVKSIIAVVGEPCDEGVIVGLQRLRSLFMKNDEISLSLITPIKNFQVINAKVTKGVIGFNADHVFTLGDAKKKPEGVTDLHAELNYNDYCIDFTIKNHGNVFVSDNFLHAKGAQRKQFAQSVSYNIVNQLLTVEEELECECQFVNPFAAQNVCKVISSKPRAAPTKKGGHKA